MKLQYDTGPERVGMGAAGEFRRGEAREVPDELAAGLLKKTTIKFKPTVGADAKTGGPDASRDALHASRKKKED